MKVPALSYDGQIYPKGGDDVFRGFLKPSPSFLKKGKKKAKVKSTCVDTYNRGEIDSLLNN